MLGLQDTRPSENPTSTKTFSCVICSETFNGLASLLLHQTSHTSDMSRLPVTSSPTPSPTCGHCLKLFMSQELLEQHRCEVAPYSEPQDDLQEDHQDNFQEDLQEHLKEELQDVEVIENTTTTVDPVFGRNSTSASEDEGNYSPYTHNDPLLLGGPTEKQESSFDNDDVYEEDQDDMENIHSDEVIISDDDESREETSKPTTNNVLKILASAYMSCRQAEQVKWGQKTRALPPRKVSPRAPLQAPPLSVATFNTECSLSQTVYKSPSPEGSVPSSGTHVVKYVKSSPRMSKISLIKIMYPVVELETHQILIKDHVKGTFQCGLCRRVFQEKDHLIMHHALHRKERVEVCQLCQEFVISMPSFPKSHVCWGSEPRQVASDLPYPKKLFHCLLCNRSYTRMHRLRTHSCLGSSATTETLRSFHPKEAPPKANRTVNHMNVGVNTMTVKSEDARSSENRNHLTIDTSPPQSEEEGQWTIPLDDAEMDVLSGDEGATQDSEDSPDEDVVCIDPPPISQLKSLNRDIGVHVSDWGVRRYSCNRCLKTYSRRFTLIQHLKICRPGKLFNPVSMSSHLLALRKKFPCPNCGVAFTRKDNMNMHRKRCQTVQKASDVEEGTGAEKPNQASGENIFVLPPDGQNNRQEGSSKGPGNWGIMSLPSVLPRKVTCECGSAFKCPKLLFEHLQMHAAETYICSRCGESLCSWAAYESHQQLHGHYPQDASEDKVIPLHKEVQTQTQQGSEQTPKKDSPGLSTVPLSHRAFSAPYTCHRCQNVFRKRRYLLKHMRFSCKGKITSQTRVPCSRCGSTFQNAAALDSHMRSASCTPGLKPLRCSVCVRWFSSLEGLQKHLLSHSKQEDMVCPVCSLKFTSLSAMEEHKGRVHGLGPVPVRSPVKTLLGQSSLSGSYSCQLCHRTYGKLQSLKDHLRKVHRPKGHFLPPFAPIDLSMNGSAHVPQFQAKMCHCNICGRMYPDIQSLRNHRRRVHRILGGGLAPIRGALQPSLSNPFQCQICSRSYPDITSLRNHRRRVHRILGGLGMEVRKESGPQTRNSVFECPICQFRCPDLASLETHKQTAHPVLPIPPDSPEEENDPLKDLKLEFLPITIASDGSVTVE